MAVEYRVSSNYKIAMSQLDSLDHEMTRSTRKSLFRIGDEFNEELNRQVLKKPRSGRTYVRKIGEGGRRRHVASRAGESPANRTGRYRKGRGYNIRGNQQLEWGIRDVPYSKFLESGTRNMAPRPGVQNTYKAKQNQIPSIIESDLKNLFRT